MSAGKGCIQPLIAPHLHKVPFRMHAAMGAARLASFDQRESGLVAAMKDQSQTSSCEAHSGSGATETCFALAGIPLGFTPSEKAMYDGLRAVERARRTLWGQSLPPLKDDGGMTEDCLTFLGTFGVTPRSVAQSSDGRNSDVEIATVNAEPTLLELEAAATLLVVGPYAIDPGASDVEQQVQAALAANIPVRVDAFVDGAFEDWTPSKAPIGAPDTNDTRGGGHAMYLVGYGPGYYVSRSSWGTNCGDGGDFFCSPAWLRAVWGLYPWTVKRAS